MTASSGAQPAMKTWYISAFSSYFLSLSPPCYLCFSSGFCTSHNGIYPFFGMFMAFRVRTTNQSVASGICSIIELGTLDRMGDSNRRQRHGVGGTLIARSCNFAAATIFGLGVHWRNKAGGTLSSRTWVQYSRTITAHVGPGV